MGGAIFALLGAASFSVPAVVHLEDNHRDQAAIESAVKAVA